ncbi:protein TIFY 5A-like [Actinidia eriantha]|uniref:protein TIFY 5A-like n=1 Tax=Actinidia eriantha TaxID=165200 RepID=UPI0025895FA4|nr:protein TIFY 5A-like [Actinidia eriantha]
MHGESENEREREREREIYNLKMRRNCNLELRLVPPSSSLHTVDYNQSMSPKDQRQKEQQQLTIFYNGRVSVCDVTELQARAIINLASREMEEKLNTPTGLEPSSPLLQSQLYSPNSFSMKRSLQQFLEKRKHRIQATSPYNH